MGWLMLSALGIMWAACVLPGRRKRATETASVEEFERGMELLAGTDGAGAGRWILTPRKGIPFLGPRGRARARARERRRRVLVVLLESIALTLLIGLVPPLRAMWYGTAGLLTLLGAYVWLLLAIKHRSVVPTHRERVRQAQAPRHAPRQARQRYVDEGRGARSAFNGLGALGPDEVVSVVVRPARHADAARV
ncbi:MAG: hypothetical protein ACE14W_02725 [Candidatus Velamenicoccus archaeovorus]